ncbi:hypothetical protein ACFLR7_04575 [Acidobacteriota bacterium]
MNRKVSLLLSALMAAGLCFYGFARQDRSSDPEIQKWKRLAFESRNSNYRLNQEVSYRWARMYGADDKDEVFSIDQTLDGGYIVAVKSYSFYDGGFRVWIVKLSPTGSIEWENLYLGGYFSRVYCVRSVSDGGYIFSGMNSNFDGRPNKSFLVKLFPDGSIQWTYNYGGETGDKLTFIEETSDGGFICAGLIGKIIDGENKDLWALKIRSDGTVEWEKKYGGPGKEGEWMHDSEPPTIRQTSDGGYILAGTTESFGQGWTDLWVLKLKPNTEGEIDWQYTYGGIHSERLEFGPCVAEASDSSGYFVGATTLTFGYLGAQDPWVLKLSPKGKVIWQRTYGGEKGDGFASLQATNDGGCVVCGTTTSFNLSSLGKTQMWVFKVNGQSGDIVWECGLGMDTKNSWGHWVESTDDNGVVVAGDMSGEEGKGLDFVVVKLGPNGELVEGNSFRKNTNAVVQDTFVQPVPTQEEPRRAGGKFFYELVSRTAVVTDSFLITWNLHQPPSSVTFVRESNRTLFSGEAIHTIGWSPNPANSEYNIVEYRIYRKETGISHTVFELVGVIPGNVLEFKDEELDSTKFFIYAVTSVDAEGNESGRSEPVGNGL